VSVSDRCDQLPVVSEPVDPHGRRRVGGHGWPIVCRLARDVRVTDLPSGGKCITAVVPLS
jgi:anti-sigma regulatory factor (Ser/Thr protein kinase)